MRAWGRPDRHATIGGIRHAGPAPAPCEEGYASPLTRARGAWRTETPVVPRFSRGKGFRPLDNGCFLCCLFVCFPVCVLIVWLVLCLLVSAFLGCLFLFSFVCSVGFGRSVWLVLLRWTGCVLRSGLSGLCVRDGVRLVRPCFSVWSCRPVFPAVRSCPVFLSVLVFFPSSFFFRRPLFASDGWRRAAGVRPVRRAGLPFSPCLPLSSSACPAEDDAHALVCFVKFLWAVSAFLLVRLSGCF